jgi:hypothetical protein
MDTVPVPTAPRTPGTPPNSVIQGSVHREFGEDLLKLLLCLILPVNNLKLYIFFINYDMKGNGPNFLLAIIEEVHIH